MRCPFCGHHEDKVVDSRESREGDSIRRRRECLKCGRRFTSYERVEEVPLLIVKKDGRREPFDRQKLMRGIMAACQKRPVSLARQEELVSDIQARLLEQPDREIASRDLGELVMDGLKAMDSVAYVRFASVYRQFKDLPDFVKALEGMMAGAQPPKEPMVEPKGQIRKPVSPPPTPTGIPSASPLFPDLGAASLPKAKRRR
ncbi:MAG: nrdR [Holophagaceae bacterium]|nr:nrdR [Holophagaceae bacterium]